MTIAMRAQLGLKKRRGSFRHVALGGVALAALMVRSPDTAGAATLVVTSTADSGAGSLRAAITSAGSGDTIQFQVGGTITLASELPIITKNITIDGNGNNPVISGADTYRPFFIGDAGTTGSTYAVMLKNLAIANAVAQGGAGLGAGAGAGLGGAIFVSSNGALTLSNVAVSNTQAHGGNAVIGYTGWAGGGGGMGGAGAGNATPGGGGGLFVGSNANGFAGAGPNGGTLTYNNTGNATGGAGGFASGGGGGASGSGTATGGAGGFGGGGGAGNAGTSAIGGAGGYGGGGGSAASSPVQTGGVGGFGGGGGGFTYSQTPGSGMAGAGGFGAGNGGGGSVNSTSGGGGGLGAGGAVFVQSGGTVTVQGDLSQQAGSVSGGAGFMGGGSGSAFGSGIFFQGSSGTATVLGFGAGNQSIADGIADYIGSGGTNPSGGTNLADQGGSVAVSKSNGGTLTLSAANTYSGGTTINEGTTLVVGAGGALGSGALTLNGGTAGVSVIFTGSFSVGNNIVATGDPTYNVTTGNTVDLTGVLSGSGDVVVNGQSGYAGTLILSAANTYTGGTFVNAGKLLLSGAGTLGAATGTTTVSGGTLDLGGTTQTQMAFILAGGTIRNGSLNAPIVSSGGAVDGIAGSASLTTTSGTTNLAGANTYGGGTTVNGGVLDVAGSLSGQSVINAGTLTGAGAVGVTFVNAGGTFAPGNGTPGSFMTINGSLAFQSGAIYLVQVNPSIASYASVTGTAQLGGATVNAVFANGGYVSKTYTILTTAGGVSGNFGSLVNTNLPANFHTSLSYDANNAYLNLVLNFAIPGGLNGNQQAVGNALTSFFNANGSIPLIYGALTPAGLTQASGELGAGAQQTTFQAMGQFMGLLTDPFTQRTGGMDAASGAPGFADEDDASAYAARKRTDAFAMITKAPPRGFEQRWSVWAAGFGGSQTTGGNAIVGSNDATSRVFGTAVGADYRVSADTLAGFALAGGGTNFSVANGLGSGRSDLFQAGAYLRHTSGPAYLSASLAYGWQDITTDRTVTIAGTDRLRAEFNANAYSGRLEGGWRFVTPWIGGIGLTPYGAAQFTTFDLPAYAERVISGAGAFALTYAARSVTDTRSELGLRSDKTFAMHDGVLTLRGRLAWAHDFNPDRAIGATFQALPGASFVVNGAAQAHDSALTTASAEMRWMSGWSAAATFEGEFSNVTRSYAGKGSISYTW